MNNQALSGIKALVIDGDGVLWHGDVPVPGLTDFFDFIRRQGIPFMLATNNASKTQAQYVEKFAKMGVEIFPHEVMTSSLATAEYLKGRYPAKTRIHVLGQDGIREAVASAGFTLADKDVEAVVAGLDFSLTYEKLKTAVLCINNSGATFIGTNPDLTFPSSEGMAPGNGSILAAITAATGQEPLTIGKPERAIYDLCLQKLGSVASETAMLGDRLETDIVGAKRVDMKSILVLSGVSQREDIVASGVEPDWVFAGVAELAQEWQVAVGK